MKNSCSHTYKIRDLHSGDTICEKYRLIISERLFFEVECPDVYSKTIIKTHDLYDTELLSNALKDSKREKKQRFQKSQQYCNERFNNRFNRVEMVLYC